MKAKLLTALLLVAAMPLRAQDDDLEDRPGRGVARISLINGDVSVRRGDSGDWTAAAVNAPLVVEDRVLTGPGSRAEVQFDYANMVRVAAGSEVRLAELEQARYILQLASGTVTFRVLRDSNADVEISTPSIAVRPAKRGIYRVTVTADGASEVTVRSGEAEIFTPKGSQRLRSGRTMLARGPVSDPEFQLVNASNEDDWDRWNERRDRDLDRSGSYRYVSRDIYGAEDLDPYGRWVNVPPYGWVWSPQVAAGWAPYRAGRWAWIDWYGWSWVSYDPWGWAPYHYGRWFYNAPVGWCWWPGGVGSRHFWRPALVGFFGWSGGGIGVGFGGGFGRIGWCPLAPYERFRPWYGSRYYGGFRNGGYVNNRVNIVNNVNITNVYRNARVRDSMTIVNGDDFRAGRAGRLQNLSDNDLRRASVVQGQVPMVPGRESLRLSDRDPGRGNSSTNDRFFSRREPSRIDRVSFDDQRRGMEQVARRSFGEEQGRAAETTGGGGRGWRRLGEGSGPAESPARNTGQLTRQADEGERGGWRRFGEPSRSTSAGTMRPDESGITRGAEAGRGGWRTFGEPSQTRQSEPSVRGAEGGGRSRDGGAGWRRWNDAAPAESGSRRSEFPGRGESPRGMSRPEESVRIGPSIIRERGAPPRSGGEFGGRRSEPLNGPMIRGGGGEMRGPSPGMRGGGGEMRGGGGGSMGRSSGGFGGGGGGGGVRSSGGGGGGGRSGGGGGGGRGR